MVFTPGRVAAHRAGEPDGAAGQAPSPPSRRDPVDHLDDPLAAVDEADDADEQGHPGHAELVGPERGQQERDNGPLSRPRTAVPERWVMAGIGVQSRRSVPAAARVSFTALAAAGRCHGSATHALCYVKPQRHGCGRGPQLCSAARALSLSRPATLRLAVALGVPGRGRLRRGWSR